MATGHAVPLKKLMGASVFPPGKRGGCAIKKMLRSHRKGRDGVVSLDEHSPQTDHPAAPAKWLRAFLYMARPPLLFQEGTLLPRSLCFPANIQEDLHL